VFGIDEEPGMEMENQMGNNNKGKSDIAIQLNGPADQLPDWDLVFLFPTTVP
jgi:hypothetical protein